MKPGIVCSDTNGRQDAAGPAGEEVRRRRVAVVGAGLVSAPLSRIVYLEFLCLFEIIIYARLLSGLASIRLIFWKLLIPDLRYPLSHPLSLLLGWVSGRLEFRPEG